MREVYRGTTETLTLAIEQEGVPVDADGAVLVTITNINSREVVVDDQPAIHPSVGTYTFLISRTLTANDAQYRVEWTWTENAVPQSEEYTFEVVTPYTTVTELRDIPELSDRTDAELMAMERQARYVINAFTGQSFGREIKTVTMYTNVTLIQLQERMYRLDKIEIAGHDVTYNYFFDPANPFHIEYQFAVGIPQYYDIKSDTYYSRLAYPTRGRFDLKITGAFGWEYVPQEVNLAAKLVVRDFFTDEAKWREAGVNVMRAADWRVEFASHPRNTTGNVNADMILEKYRLVRMIAL